jgi:hypothetical protein
MVLEGHGGKRRHLGDHAQAGDHALVRIGDVGRVMIESRQRADTAAHDGHRMRIAAEAGEEAATSARAPWCGASRGSRNPSSALGRQFAVQQQVADFEEVAMLGQLLDRITAMEQDALVAVDIGDFRFTGRGRGETRIVREGSRVSCRGRRYR